MSTTTSGGPHTQVGPVVHPSPVRGPWSDSTLSTSERVEALLEVMTTAEKVAQLSSAWEDVEPAGPEVAPGTSLFPPVGDLTVTARFGLGQLTRPYGTVPRTALENAALYAERQRQVMDQSRFGIPAMGHDECLTGFTTMGATIYPTSLAMAATFDPALIERVGRAIGADMAQAGVHQALAPVVDVVRDYRWGRCEETYGEDPYLVAEIASAYVRGLQVNGVRATLKHFAGYAASMGGRNHAPVHIGPRELADVILPPFERLVAEGVGSVMNSYADIDGDAPAASRWLLTELLRDRWGFEGTVVSDYWSLPFLVTAHRVAADYADAGARSLRAGMDVELPDQRGFGDELVSAVELGRASVDDLDRSVRRVLRQKIELGLCDVDFDPVPKGLRDGSLDLDKPENRQLAFEVAQRSAVLLSNDGVLPLAASGTIALIGPCADDVRTMFGCYSFPNHVLSDAPDDHGVDVVSLRTALAEELPAADWRYERGCAIRDTDRSQIAEAVATARSADVVILVVGDRAGMFGIGTSGEGCDVEDLRLPGVQEELVDAVLAANPRTVLIVNSGRPYALGRFTGAAAAMLQVFLPGEEGGRAVASLLSGRANFSGKLPVQIPTSSGCQPYTYLHAPLGDRQSALSNLDPTPAFAFGHGLSYTAFRIDGLTVDKASATVDDVVTATVQVRNVGPRAGIEVVQLYYTDPLAEVARPVRALLGFAAVHVDAGAAATVRFTIDTDRFAFTGLDGVRAVEPGEIELCVGSSSLDHAAKAMIELTGERRDVIKLRAHAVPVEVLNG